MTTSTPPGGCLVVYTKAAPGREDEFNRWYDEVHLPEVLALGPFTSAQRFRVAAAQAFEQSHQYVSVYAFEGDPAEALRTLIGAAGALTMSDAMVDPFMTVGVALGPRVDRQ